VRVLQLVSSLGPTASARYLAHTLPHLGVETHVLNFGIERPFSTELISKGIPVETIAPRGPIDLASLRTLVLRTNAFAPQIVHVWGVRAAAFANVLVLPFCRPPFTLVRSESATIPSGSSLLAIRTDRRSRATFHPEPVVDPSTIKPVTFTEFDWAPDSKFVLNVGAFDEHSDQRAAVWTFDMLRYVHPTARMLVVGDGPLRARVESFARSISRGDDRIHFLGLRSDVPAILRSSSIAFVSHRIGGGMFLAEALNAGVPVVAVSTDVSRGMIHDGRNGRLVPRGDHPAQTRALIELLNDEGLARRFGAAGRESPFATPESAASELTAFYRSVAG
jgi:glycosyltransferase involved in cell wall biosynthesis